MMGYLTYLFFLFFFTDQLGEYLVVEPPMTEKGERRKKGYAHDLRCPYCEGQYVAPSASALRKHVSRFHREEHRYFKENARRVELNELNKAMNS